jgi:DNA mismatch endonuclease (patch repair protein)
VLPRFKTAIFVHGCFWHGHECKHGAVASKSNAAFWSEKIRKNRERDERKRAELTASGWNVETVWECETHGGQVLQELIERIRRRKT